MSLCATSVLMKYINAHIPQRRALLLLVLILLPAWTHEGRKRRGVFERKTGVPMGIPHKERKEMERREDGSAGRGGGCSGWRMNINNMLENSHNGQEPMERSCVLSLQVQRSCL